MTEPRLETPRLLLRLMRPSDLDDLQRIFGDPKVTAAFGIGPYDREHTQRWMQRNLEHQDLHGYGLFSVILKSEGALIGDCGLEHMVLDRERVTELGYDFRSEYWNRGYATEAATTVRDYAFDILQLPGLISLIRHGNEASRRVSEKIGMRRLRELERHGISYWEYGLANPSSEAG